MKTTTTLLLTAVTLFIALPAAADNHSPKMTMMSSGLFMPRMDAAEGRTLFASKGCVVCHSINGVGGEDAPMLDAEFMDMPMNPFDFAAKMWRGAPAMVAMQEDEMGGQIEFTGEELAAMIAFVHDADEQTRFSEADIPEEIEMMMHHEGEDEHHKSGESDDHN